MTVEWNPQQAEDAIRRAALRGVVRGANLVRNEMLRLILNTPKSGVIYTRRGVTHQASAPGEPPASDQGTLVREIRVVVQEEKLQAQVNSGAAHSAPLEFGTQYMEPRPFARRALENVRAQVEAAVGNEIAVVLAGAPPRRIE